MSSLGLCRPHPEGPHTALVSKPVSTAMLILPFKIPGSSSLIYKVSGPSEAAVEPWHAEARAALPSTPHSMAWLSASPSGAWDTSVRYGVPYCRRLKS